MTYYDSISPEGSRYEVVAASSVSACSLPKSFGKCLGYPSTPVAKIIRSKTLSVGPKLELKGDTIIAAANNTFELKGTLKMDNRGFVYVDLQNEWIYDLFPLLDTAEASLPPYFDPEKPYGAHISVALASEQRLNIPMDFLDTKVDFKITGCFYVEPENWVEMEKVWFLTIEAPTLSEIRTQMGLDPKISGHEFHITFALQKRIFSLEDVMTSDHEVIVTGTGDVTRSKIRKLRNATNKA